MYKFLQWLSDKSAVSGVEYSFFAAFISLAILVAAFTFGDSFYNMFNIFSGFLSGNLNNLAK